MDRDPDRAPPARERRLRGTGCVYLRGRVFWIKYPAHGETRYESARSPRRRDAERLLARRLGELGVGLYDADAAERTTWDDLAALIRDDYRVRRRRSGRALESSLKHLAAAFGGWRLRRISGASVRAYVGRRREEGAADATIRKELAALRRAFTLARAEWPSIPVPPIPSIAVHNVRTNTIREGDLRAILEALPPPPAPHRALVALLWWTGMRWDEARGLRWAAVDEAAGMIRLEGARTKSGRGRAIPFGDLPEVAALLAGRRETVRAIERETGAVVPWVFCHADGREVRDIRGAWKAAAEAAGLPGAWIHDLRREALRNLRRAGVDPLTARAISGHRTASVYERYQGFEPEDLREAARKRARLAAEGRTVRRLRDDPES